MKKIFIVFIISVIVFTVLIVPCFASMTSSFGSYTNLFDPSDVVQARFYIDSDNYQDNNFYLVDLQQNTDYTFISTKGSRRFYFGESVLDSQNYNSVYSFKSSNLLNSDLLVNNAFTKNSDGSYTLTKLSSNERFSNIVNLDLPFNTYTLTVNVLSGNAPIRAQIDVDGYSLYYTFSSSGSYTFTESIRSVRFFLNSSVSDGSSSVVFNLSLNESSSSLPFEEYYIDPVYVNSDISVVSFNSGYFSDDTYIGINDILSGSTSNLFSSNQSSENEFYLIEGKLTVDQISSIIAGNNYQNGYNSGYDQGYKEGEYDGLNSSKFMNSTLLTAISAPFVIVSSALDFDILGINFYNILKVLFTLLLVAFVVNKLKGRE